MLKIYLLGGENVSRRSAKEVNQRAFQDAKQPVRVLVFPWARASFDLKYRRRKMLHDYFLSLGGSSVEFVDYSESTESIGQKMANSSIVYLTGGQFNILVERLKNKKVDNLLANYNGVIVGRSAGALAVCRRGVTTCRSNSKSKIYSGLGLADLTLKVHYDPVKDLTLMELSQKEKIHAIPEGSAIVYDNGRSSFINSSYLFYRGKKQILS